MLLVPMMGGWQTVVQWVLLILVADNIVGLDAPAESGSRLNPDHLENSTKASRGMGSNSARSREDFSFGNRGVVHFPAVNVVLEGSRLIVLLGGSVMKTKGRVLKQEFAHSCQLRCNLARRVVHVVSSSAAASHARHNSDCSVGPEITSVGTVRQVWHTALKLLQEVAVD